MIEKLEFPRNDMTTDPLRDTWFLTRLRRDMLRFADIQLRNKTQAEDAGQGVLTAALAGYEKSASRVSLRTSVLAIRKNKIVNVPRRKVRENVVVADEDADSDIDANFNDRSYWAQNTPRSEWESPDKVTENKRFWEVFEACLYRLPKASTSIFTMREVPGFDSDNICATLAITSNNCWVQLHRTCLGVNWFGEAT